MSIASEHTTGGHCMEAPNGDNGNRRYRGYDNVPMIDIVERSRVRDDPDIAEWREREVEQLRDENTFLKKGNVGLCEASDDASEQEMTLEEITAEIQQLLNDKNVFGLPND